jgi:hypothetical protein
MRRRVFVPSMQGHDERSGEDSPAWNRSGTDRFRMSKMRLCDQCAQHPGRASLVNSGRKRRVPDRQACALYRRVTGIDVGLRVTLPPCFLVEPRRGWPRLAGISSFGPATRPCGRIGFTQCPGMATLLVT